MPRAGGPADKLGNQYEATWTVDAVLNVFFGKVQSITVEAFGDESQGVEFHLETIDKKLQFHSLKRQKQNGDWSVAELCKPSLSTERSILGDLFNKRRAYENAELKFVSATGANQLRELTERAESPTSLAEFQKSIISSANLQSEFFNRIVPIRGGEEEFAFRALKSLEVVLVSQRELTRRVEQRMSENFYRRDRSQFEPADFRRMISEFVLDNLGPPISTERIRNFVDSLGFGTRDWKTDRFVNDSVKRLNERYLVVTETELINTAQIVRDEANQMFEEISKPGSHGVLLVAPGGYGKSCVIAQFLSRLTTDGIPAIVLRMDSLEPCQTSRQIGKQLDLPASPTLVLAGIADNSKCLLIIDQLDAMSLVSGRNPKMWEVFQELLAEASTYPHMKVVLACREFDLNHDHRLRRLGEEHSGFKKIKLDKLSTQDIRMSLDASGLGALALNEKQLAILGIPFHLLLFLQGKPSSNFLSVGQLYDNFWSRKRTNLRERLGHEASWDDVVDTLTAWMSDRQVLFAPKMLVDKWQLDAKAMVSEHVLVEVQGQYRFFHESFFDYAYARGFCSTGASLVEFLFSSEQHLFRRAQVRQILAYRRENDFSQYVADVRQIFDSNSVRFHIKCMVASAFRQVIDPTRDEWELLKPHLLDGDFSRYVSQALRDHVGWFDLLERLNVFQNWLGSNDERFINTAIWFFEALELQDQRSSRIAELLAPYVNNGDDWQKRLIRLMSWGKAHKSDEMSRIYLGLVRQGVYDEFNGVVIGNDDLWGQHHNADKECPKFIIDVLATWFDRTVEKYDDGEAPNFFDNCRSNHSHVGSLSVGNAASREPAYFVEQILPRVIATILKTEIVKGDSVRNRAWPYLTNSGDPFDVNDAVLLYLRKALEWLAVNDIETFRKYSWAMTKHPHETLGYLLLRSWAENPKEFADECTEYLVADQRRLNIGYSICIGADVGNGESAISRIALRSISPHCSDAMLRQLESAIIGYCDEFEKQNPRRRGFAELLVLRSLDRRRISQKTALRIEELERKFPTITDEIVKEDTSCLPKCVGSPIAQKTFDLMTDRQWIGAMQKYDGSTDRFRGGPVELSRSLAELARRDRPRFASLALKMPECVDPTYFSAILDGLSGRYVNLGKEEKESDQKIIEATLTEVFLKVIDRLHSLPKRPCGTAILGCVRILSERQLPLQLLEIVSHYAVSDPNPETDIWREEVNGNKYYDGDPQFHGINCVRGQAAGTIADLICDDKSRFEDLRPALISLSSDPIISVRSCAIEALTHLLNVDPDLAIDLFLRACEDCIEICRTSNFDQFVYYAISRDYNRISSLLQFALNSDCEAVVEIAARHIILAELSDVDVGSNALEIRSGNEPMRRAAATVYANNLTDAQVGNKCSEFLEMFFDDPSEKVREIVSRSFFNISGPRLLELEGFISRFIERKSFENETDRLLYALEESNVELPHVICRAAERILEFIGVEGTQIAYRGSMVAMNISTLVVRQYEQTTDDKIKIRCLNLIDSIERAGLLGIGDELNKIDR